MAVNALDRFNIDIFKLSNTTHHYEFDVTDAFFKAFPVTLVEHGKGTVKASLEKSELLMKLSLTIDVSVELECDRSLEQFDFPIHVTKDILFKYGEEEEELDDNIVVITKDKQRLNLAQYIFEFIGLEIPMKKLHPKYGEDSAGDEIIFSSEASNPTEDESTDPRWEQLKKLK